MSTTKNKKRIWLTTDWHLFHKNIMKYESRPQGFEKLITGALKKNVGEEDTVIHLGDVIFGPQSQIQYILQGLPGKYILTRGNHDRKKNTWYVSHGFFWSCKAYEYKDILFSHRPMDLSLHPSNLKYNIHGHFHTNDREDIERTQKFYPFYTENHLMLSLEYMDYKPILLEDFMKLKDKEWNE